MGSELKSDMSVKIAIDFTTSNGFSAFLVQNRISLAVSTYQTDSLFLIGPEKDDALSINVIKFKRPMGLFATPSSLYVAGKSQLWRFNNILPPGESYKGHDRIFVPQVGWTTGDLDIHDVVQEQSGKLVFVNTKYSCLSTVSSEHSFIPLWKPPNIDDLKPEDRCHLNGVTMRDGKIAFATAFSRANTRHAWREKKDATGVLWDIQNNKLLLEGLSMPHSPRWHAEQLWILDSGTGRFGSVNLKTKIFEPLIELPGYLRGLSFFGDFAFVGSSAPREDSGIADQTLTNAIAAMGGNISCGIFVVNWRSGKLVHFVHIAGAVQEIYDIAVLPNVSCPRGIGLEDEDLDFFLNIGSEPMPSP